MIVNFYCDAIGPLITAMIRAEGGTSAFIHAVACSFPETDTINLALARTAKTIRNRIIAYNEFQVGPLYETIRAKGKDPWTGEDDPRRLRFTDQFIAFLGARWAPIGALNDPTSLNLNWVPNVTRIYRELLQEMPDGRERGAGTLPA